MWVSRKEWSYLNQRIEKSEREIRDLKEHTDEKIRNMAKRILEQPQELLEELRSVEIIEKMIDDFIRS